MIQSFKKFIKIIDCIGQDTFELTINTNNIEYKSSATKFKFHLINDNIVKIQEKVLLVNNVDKIGSLLMDNNYIQGLITKLSINIDTASLHSNSSLP